MECKKCKAIGTVLLRRKDYYCEACFLTNTNHKFRACIGKNKVLPVNERVLVCLSRGLGSVVMLDLIANGILMDNHKKLRIIPIILHIMGTHNSSHIQAENILKNCRTNNFETFIVPISHYMTSESLVLVPNQIPTIQEEVTVQFKSMIDSMPTTTSNDLLPKIKRSLYLKVAKSLDCRFIFTAETTTTLAINLLSNLAVGRGAQVEDDVGFCDSRDDIKILRSMKDITQEELNHYIKIKQLDVTINDTTRPQSNNSLQSVIGAFVSDLQNNFPATISTVCKTADKIGVHDHPAEAKKCIICESDLGKLDSNLTALEATMFSRSVSYCFHDKTVPGNVNNLESIEKSVDSSLFPYIHQQLCYCCSKNYCEMKKCNIPLNMT